MGPSIKITIPEDFEERYKEYRLQLGDKKLYKSIELDTEMQERIARDFEILNSQLEGLRGQLEVSNELKSGLLQYKDTIADYQKAYEKQQETAKSMAKSLAPMLKVAEHIQEEVNRLNLPAHLRTFNDVYERTKESAAEIQRITTTRKISLPMTYHVVPKEQQREEVVATPKRDYQQEMMDKMEDILEALTSIDGKTPSLKTEKPTQPISLEDFEVRFDDDKSMILVGQFEVPLPPAKNEQYLSRSMFNRPINEYVDWSTVHQEITGVTEEIGEESDMKALRDTVNRLNKRIQEVVPTEDKLIHWENKSISRQF